MFLILSILVIVFVLCFIRSEKIKSFKKNLIIDAVIFAVMLIIVILSKFDEDKTVRLVFLLLWILIGTFFRKFYPKFEFWIENKQFDF